MKNIVVLSLVIVGPVNRFVREIIIKVLLLGNGGREHAIAWKLAQSKNLTKLYTAPGNPGTAQFGENVDIAATDIEKLVDFAKQNKIGLMIAGPEAPVRALGSVWVTTVLAAMVGSGS